MTIRLAQGEAGHLQEGPLMTRIFTNFIGGYSRYSRIVGLS